MFSLSHSNRAPLRMAGGLSAINSGHFFSGTVQEQTVLGKFQPEAERHVILELWVHLGVKPGIWQLALQTDPAHFHSPPLTGFKSVDSHFLCGVVVVAAGAFVGFAAPSTVLSVSPFDIEACGFCCCV